MNTATLFGLCGAILIGLGLYGALTHPQPLRKLIAFNLLGSGIFLVFGAIARRGAWGTVGGDPVPQALVITPFEGAALDVGPQDARVIIRVDAQGAQSLATD